MHQTHIAGVDLNLLPALAALLEERHVSRAATRVGLSQPAMSRALQRLRRIFDDALLVSGPDGYTLTQRAERVHSRLAAVLSELDALFGAEDFDPMTAQESYRLELSDYSVAAFGADLARTIRAESPGSRGAVGPRWNTNARSQICSSSFSASNRRSVTNWPLRYVPLRLLRSST